MLGFFFYSWGKYHKTNFTEVSYSGKGQSVVYNVSSGLICLALVLQMDFSSFKLVASHGDGVSAGPVAVGYGCHTAPQMSEQTGGDAIM